MAARLLVAAALLIAWLAGDAHAQDVSGRVLATCGTAGYPLGFGIITMDQTGTLCTAGGGGGGGGSVTQGTVPWVDSITTWGGGTLGAMANYGTSPGAVLVPGVNASVTNFPANPATSTLQTTANTSLATIASNTAGPYPNGAIPITATATGTTGATTATLAANATLKTYICGFSIRANATAAATGNATVTGVVTATINFTQWTAPNAAGLGVTEEVFMPCVPSSATNTAIAVVSAAPGTGGVVSVTAWGYQL